MNNATKGLVGLLVLGALAMPVLALAQADNEGSEGSCSDEMSEGSGCGAAGAGSSYSSQSNYSYSTPTNYSYSSPTNYSYPTSQYYSSNSYTPTYQSNYQTYTPSYQSYTPSYNYGYSGNTYSQTYPYTTSYSYPSYTSANNSYGYGSYAPASYSNNYQPMYGNTYQFSTQRYLTPPPQTYSIPTGTYSWGNQLCYWSDYQGLAPCGQDPQQWVYDPYSGTWH